MILGINTAQATHELALLDQGSLLLERRWLSEKKEVEGLVPLLQEMLDEVGKNKTEITQIVVVKGPGSFSSTRTGVVFANALAEGLGAQLYSLDTFELLVKKAALSKGILPLLFAGGVDAALKAEGEIFIGSLATLLAPFSHAAFQVVAELPDALNKELHSICLEKSWTQIHELKTLGQVLLTSDLEDWKVQDVVEVAYLRKPFITPSSNRWKQ